MPDAALVDSTLRTIAVAQRSPEWLEARRGIVTASAVGLLVTPKTVKVASNDQSRGLLVTLASERISGRVTDTYQSMDMLRGVLDEPYARTAYTAATGMDVEEAGFMLRCWPDGAPAFQLGYSPDGLAGEGLIEVKSRLPKKHVETVLADAVPLENLAQCQAALLVTGRPWIDYVSFCGGLPLWIKRVYPSTAWHDAILAATQAAEQTIREHLDTFAERTAGLHVPDRPDHDQEIVI